MEMEQRRAEHMGKISQVAYEVRDARATISINREKCGNRISSAVSALITEALLRAESDSDVRVIVLTGNGEVFSLGGEPAGYPGRDITEQLEYAESFLRLISVMNALRKPIIARVNGDALAGGTSLVASCDLAVAADHCRFGFPEIDEGSFPMLALGVIHSTMPAKLTMELCFTGRLLSAEEARGAWFVNQVVSMSELDSALDAMVAEILKKRTAALGIGRVGFHAMANMSPDSRLRYAQVMMTTMFSDIENESNAKQKGSGELAGRQAK